MIPPFLHAVKTRATQIARVFQDSDIYSAKAFVLFCIYKICRIIQLELISDFALDGRITIHVYEGSIENLSYGIGITFSSRRHHSCIMKIYRSSTFGKEEDRFVRCDIVYRDFLLR